MEIKWVSDTEAQSEEEYCDPHDKTTQLLTVSGQGLQPGPLAFLPFPPASWHALGIDGPKYKVTHWRACTEEEKNVPVNQVLQLHWENHGPESREPRIQTQP